MNISFALSCLVLPLTLPSHNTEREGHMRATPNVAPVVIKSILFSGPKIAVERGKVLF